MASPLVSILTITYNQRDFVDETLGSALSQAWPNLEVVVADDGSTDGTLERLQRWAARYPNQLKLLTGANLGITRNTNRGLRACTGTFIAFQGGDDVLLPGKIAAQVDWFEQSPQRALCGHDVEHFDSKTGRRICLQSQINRLRSGVGPEDILANGNPFAATSVMVRRDVIPSYGFDERLPIVSDGKMWIDCVLGGQEWGYVDGIFAKFRRHSANITTVEAPKCYAEAFMTMAIVEAEHPELAKACGHARARLHQSAGVSALMRGERARARRELTCALTEAAPLRSVKIGAWLALATLPAGLRRTLLEKRGLAGSVAP